MLLELASIAIKESPNSEDVVSEIGIRRVKQLLQIEWITVRVDSREIHLNRLKVVFHTSPKGNTESAFCDLCDKFCVLS
jgi:hypothetical protein